MAVAKETSADAAITAVWAELVDIFMLGKNNKNSTKRLFSVDNTVLFFL